MAFLPNIPVNAVAYDCDGLLVDTEECWTIAEGEVFASRGYHFGTREKEQVIGKAAPDMSRIIAVMVGEEGNEKLIADEILTRVEKVITERAKPLPGAVALVEKVSAHVPVAVVSNSPRQIVNAALHTAGMDHLFQTYVTLGDTAHPKPAPDPYQRAAELMGADPAHTLGFEDSLTGVHAGQAAGLRMVGVPTLLGGEIPRGFEADAVVSSLEDSELLAWLESVL